MKRLTLAASLLLAQNFAFAQDSSTAAAPVATPEPKKSTWESSVAAGLTLTQGNSDTVVGTINALTAKKWDQNELRFGADASYGENDSIKSTEILRGYGQYNYLFTERWFGYIRGEALHDSIADVEYRLTLSPGVGYYFIKNDTTMLSVEGGPAFIYEKQGGDEKGYIAARIAERFEHKLSDRVKIWQSLEFLPQVDNVENFIINGEIGIDTEIIKNLALRVFVTDTYDNEPAPGRKENDVKLVTAVAYKF